MKNLDEVCHLRAAIIVTLPIDCVVAVIAARHDHMIQLGVSSTISMTVGLLALIACIVLVIVLVRFVSRTTHLDEFGLSF